MSCVVVKYKNAFQILEEMPSGIHIRLGSSGWKKKLEFSLTFPFGPARYISKILIPNPFLIQANSSAARNFFIYLANKLSANLLSDYELRCGKNSNMERNIKFFGINAKIVIFYTEILTGKVVLWCFFMSETSVKIHNSTFLVKISVQNVIFSKQMEK